MPKTERYFATNILADYASDQPNLLADLLMDADSKAYAAFFPIAQRQAAKTLPLFQAEIRKQPTIPDSDKDPEMAKDRLAERQARAAITLVRMGKAGEIIPLLRHSADPRLRSFIVNWLKPLGADPQVLPTNSNTSIPACQADARRRTEGNGCHPVPPRDLAAAGVDPGTGTVWRQRDSPPSDREPLIDKLLDPLPQRPRRRYPWGGGMDLAAVGTAGASQGNRCRVDEGQGAEANTAGT